MKNKVCIFSNVGHFSEIFEIQLEIAQKHLDKGDEVDFLFCDGTIPTCEINIKKDLDTCLYCIGRRNNGLSLLKGKAKNFNISSFTKIADFKVIKSAKIKFKTLKELKDYKFLGYNLGQSVCSSISDIDREYLPSVKDYSTEIRKFIQSSVRIYLTSRRYIELMKPDIMYIYNGRHALEKAAIAACTAKRINYYTHEFAYNGGYVLCKNTQPQDHKFYTKQAEKLWKCKKNSIEQKRQIGDIFFKKKLGIKQGSISVKKKGKSIEITNNADESINHIKYVNRLPDSWDNNNQNVIIFQSSIFEEHTSPEFHNYDKIYSCQLTAIKSIVQEFKDTNSNFKFYLRLHPSFNFWNNKTQELREYLELGNKYTNLKLIKPEENISSYFLMDNASKVIAFRSTAAIESAYRKIPTIVLVKEPYNAFGCVYKPTNHQEVIELINDKDLKPKDSVDCLKFGYLQMSYGIIPKYYQRDPQLSYQENWGLFKGKVIKPNSQYTFILNLLHRQKLRLVYELMNSIHIKILKRYYN